MTTAGSLLVIYIAGSASCMFLVFGCIPLPGRIAGEKGVKVSQKNPNSIYRAASSERVLFPSWGGYSTVIYSSRKLYFLNRSPAGSKFCEQQPINDQETGRPAIT